MIPFDIGDPANPNAPYTPGTPITLPGSTARLIAINDSPYQILLQFGGLGNAGGVNFKVPSGVARIFPVQANAQQVSWTIDQSLSPATAVISDLTLETYTLGEELPNQYPIVRQLSVGNTISVSNITSLLVSGETPPHELIQVLPAGFLSPSVDLIDTGEFVLRPKSNGSTGTGPDALHVYPGGGAGVYAYLGFDGGLITTDGKGNFSKVGTIAGQPNSAAAYGAVSSLTQDNTTALQNWLNSGGGYLPPGKYGISSMLTIDADNVTLWSEAENHGAQIFVLPGFDPTYALKVGVTRTVLQFRMSNITILGQAAASNGSNTQTGGGVLLNVNGSSVSHVNVGSFGGKGITLGVVTPGTDVNQTFMADHVYCFGCGTNSTLNGGLGDDAIYISPSATDSVWSGCTIFGAHLSPVATGRYGWYIQGNDTRLIGCHAWGCYDNVHVDNSPPPYNNNGAVTPKYMAVLGCSLETAANANLLLNNLQYGVVADCLFFRNAAASYTTAYDIDVTGTTSDLSITDCQLTSPATSSNLGIFSSASGFMVRGCHVINSAALAVGINVGGGSSYGVIAQCVYNCPGQLTLFQCTHWTVASCVIEAGGIKDGAAAGPTNNNRLINNLIQGGTVSQLNTTGVARGNQGYNPLGFSVAQPGVPASGSAVTNTTGADCTVYVTGGTVTAIAVGGTSVGSGLSSGAFRVPMGITITLIYSVAPSWTWYGD